jgi:hypothetical protein
MSAAGIANAERTTHANDNNLSGPVIFPFRNRLAQRFAAGRISARPLDHYNGCCDEWTFGENQTNRRLILSKVSWVSIFLHAF